MIRKFFIAIVALAGGIGTVAAAWPAVIEYAPWVPRAELERLQTDHDIELEKLKTDHVIVAGDFYAAELRDRRDAEAQTRRLIRECDTSGCNPDYRQKLDKDLRFYQDELEKAKADRKRYRAKQRKEN